MYKAIVCKIKNIRPCPGADRLMLATVQGFQIIVGLDQEEDELGVFFPSDGCLSENHCIQNSLYRKHPDTDKPMGGYFGPNGRVKALKLRGSVSEGFWQPVNSFEWTGSINKLVEGYEFDILNKNRICEKYLTPATKKAMHQNNPKKGRTNVPNADRSAMHEHYSTKKLRYNVNKIPVGALLTISEKLHGTSGRTGLVKSKYLKYNWFKKTWNTFAWKVEDKAKVVGQKYKKLNKLKKLTVKTFTLVPREDKEVWEYLTGSRRVVIDPNQKYVRYYNGDPFREKIHQSIVSTGLQKGEIIYYEIVGYSR